MFPCSQQNICPIYFIIWCQNQSINQSSLIGANRPIRRTQTHRETQYSTTHTGELNMQDWKMQDCQITDEVARVEIDGLENKTDRKLTDGTINGRKMKDWHWRTRICRTGKWRTGKWRTCWPWPIKRWVNVNSGHKFICTLQPRIAHFGTAYRSMSCCRTMALR